MFDRSAASAPLCRLLAVAWLSFAACGESDDDRVALRVFAASSLSEAFTQIERDFESANPQLDVQTTFAGSQVLRLQLEQGARAELFASADEVHLEALERAGLVDPGQAFAHNELALIVPAANPAGLESFADLDRAERIVVGVDAVPVGRYTQQIFERARGELGDRFVDAVEAKIVSRESNVRLVRAKVELGEADAAIVYRSDVAKARGVRELPIDEGLRTRASYPIARVREGQQPEAAQRFIDYLLSEAGQRTMLQYGFEGARP